MIHPASRSLLGLAVLSLSFAAQDSQQNRSGEFQFEVFSIRPVDSTSGMRMSTSPSPNGFQSRLSLWQAIMIAYGPSTDPADWDTIVVLKAPEWTNDLYEIHARVSQEDLKTWQSQSKEHELLRFALRAALRERCKLAVHEQPVKSDNFELVVGKHGSKLKTSAPNADLPDGQKLPSGGVMVSTAIKHIHARVFYSATMQDLADFLTGLSRKTPVRDRTGLTGRYDFTLLESIIVPSDDRLFTYPPDRVGLQVRMGTEIRPMLVIDHVEKPSAN
jgi:uncharacterized protein (TIGR03435 family)